MKSVEFTLKSILLLFLLACNKDNVNQDTNDCSSKDFFSEYSSRNFTMGFSTWPYAPSEQSIKNTYQFIANNADIYSEHIDNKIPWQAWMNNLPLPKEFTDEIDSKIARKISDIKLTLSVSLLNTDRSDLAEDFDGSIPYYNSLNDKNIEDAYYKHIYYLTDRFKPDYLIIAIEVNELKINSPDKWNAYKLLINHVKTRIKEKYPLIKISESITLHNLFEPELSDPENYINEIVSYANTQDFVAISYYPFFKGQHLKADFQQAFNFLHEKISKPIAFSETSHLAENLSIDSFNLYIESNECEQNTYLETLLSNAQENNYEYIIWWAHRDFYELWLTFPEELKDLGKLWRNTGLITDDGTKRKAYYTWEKVLNY